MAHLCSCRRHSGRDSGSGRWSWSRILQSFRRWFSCTSGEKKEIEDDIVACRDICLFIGMHFYQWPFSILCQTPSEPLSSSLSLTFLILFPTPRSFSSSYLPFLPPLPPLSSILHPPFLLPPPSSPFLPLPSFHSLPSPISTIPSTIPPLATLAPQAQTGAWTASRCQCLGSKGGERSTFSPPPKTPSSILRTALVLPPARRGRNVVLCCCCFFPRVLSVAVSVVRFSE